MATRCVDLLTDETLHRRIAVAATRTIEDRFSEDRFVSEHLLLYKKTIDAYKKDGSDCETG